MSLDEFREVCNEVFKIQVDASGNKHTTFDFPDGCETCTSEIEWDCWHVDREGKEIVCSWRENYWKYKELRAYIVLSRVQTGRGTLSGMDSLRLLDYLKLSIIKEYL
jgi:hypothetical protein